MRFITLLVLLLGLNVALAQDGLWGVKVDVQLPADQHIIDFVANPIGYASQKLDVLHVMAFAEYKQFGMEARYYTLEGVSVMAYVEVPGPGETQVGLRFSNDLNGKSYLTLRGQILLYGQF